jgi:PBSX family phage terminase large subunit
LIINGLIVQDGDMTEQLFSDKQMKFVVEAVAKWNMAHGAVRTGKTYGSLLAFMHSVDRCPDSQLYMVGHTDNTIYENAIRLLFESPQFASIRPFCTWYPGKRQLKYKDKTIGTIGAKDQGAIGKFQGKTFSKVYCDEITLYPESIIDMIDTRLSMPYSQGYATMNPSSPHHKVKQWIDQAVKGNPDYYQLHFTLEDNPYVDEAYKNRIKNSLTGLFYKRNYLGLWCMAEGAIFDFFDRKIHVVERPPRAADYFIAGIDYGSVNAFACVVIGVSTGVHLQQGKQLWVEAEYYWDPKVKGRQKINSEFAEDVVNFIEPYGVRNVYIDPSAEAFQLELRRRNTHCVHANNDVYNGIQIMSKMLGTGELLIMENCKNVIREIEGYVWNPKKAEMGLDEPLKKEDHSTDAIRYALATHKVAEYNPYKQNHNPDQYRNERFTTGKRSIF